jgi:5-methylcytosine-specific restriction endonuclease McrA
MTSLDTSETPTSSTPVRLVQRTAKSVIPRRAQGTVPPPPRRPGPPAPPAAPSLPEPPSRGGARRKIARYLTEKVGIGGTFTIEQLEQMLYLSDGKRRVEADRRCRQLREVGYEWDTYQTDSSLASNERRLTRIGDACWHKHYRWPKGRTHCPAGIRRAVLERDNSTCQLCGVKAGETYPDWPSRISRVTVGRILPGSKGGSYIPSNCRVECTRCQDVQDAYNYGELSMLTR